VLEDTANAAVEACCKNCRLEGIETSPLELARTDVVSPGFDGLE
jgi:hypothetical protein